MEFAKIFLAAVLVLAMCAAVPQAAEALEPAGYVTVSFEDYGIRTESELNQGG